MDCRHLFRILTFRIPSRPNTICASNTSLPICRLFGYFSQKGIQVHNAYFGNTDLLILDNLYLSKRYAHLRLVTVIVKSNAFAIIHVMKYLEAEESCKGCAASLAIPLINLPQSVPDPNQAAMILCKAKTRPVIIEGNIRYLE